MSKSLEEYERKRDFAATPEPAADDSGPAAREGQAHALQFCIQKHDATRLHYDFRLELDGTLKSWAVPKGPSLDPGVRRLAVQVEDHPLAYATFEGHIPEGHYGAGDVIVWDRGIWIPQGDPREGYRKGRLKFELQGEKLAGLWNLVRTGRSGNQEQWFLIKSRDEAARPEAEFDVVGAMPDSVLSDRTLVPRRRGKAETETPQRKLKGARRAAQPDQLAPELATLVDQVPAGDWRYEIKFDGYRILTRIRDGEVRLFTRSGQDWTAKMPRQAAELAGLGLQSAWLDGEIVVLDRQGLPDFQALQNAFEADGSDDILYYLFDVPYLDGRDLRQVAIEERRALLAGLLRHGEHETLRFSEDFGEATDAILDSACKIRLEGLIGKRAGSHYVSRRSSDWIKLKCQNRQEFVVVGYTAPKGTRQGFGALLLGLHDAPGRALRYAGKVGTGFDGPTLRSLYRQMQPLRSTRPAVTNPPGGAEARGVHWLQPQLLAEVAYAEMTRDGLIRHAVFHGLREDKPPEAITRERPQKVGPTATPKRPQARDGTGLTLTHPERVIDASSGATKRDLAEFYERTAPWLLPQLEHRPVALIRAPEGIAGELFFQKSAEKLGVAGIAALDEAEAGQPAMVVESAEGLLGAVQMNAIELHTWNATTADLQHPDRFVLDLDPDPALPWRRMAEATGLTLTLLEELGLRAFVKTSGGKGIHLVVPLTPGDDWARVKAFAQAIARHLAKLLPDRFSAVAGPKNRVGRIFVDYLRNGQGATTVAAYSVRAREGLPVSVPVFPEEVAELKGADAWTLRNLHERLADDPAPWADYPSVRQRITAEMRRRLRLREA